MQDVATADLVPRRVVPMGRGGKASLSLNYIVLSLGAITMLVPFL